MKTCIIIAKFKGLPQGCGMWYSIAEENAEEFVAKLGDEFILRLNVDDTDPVVGRL